MLNKLPEQEAYEIIKKRTEIFMSKLNISYERLLLWGYSHAVLATSWSVDGENYDECFFKSISIFKSLCESSAGAKLEKVYLND
ncbi:hypothetical protein [Alkalibacillus haloalkaliphilus]|uniref:hypothetical protein n=1 Tax=Alkalibacillus haloalkaliphilus TaxID=94136 RepID=UPI0012FD5750|nr:hypothetical protein [Alkalibacillus haloalkaliphilus]